ncbi:MAG: hypothetical protein KJ583_07745 [Nanoarchaeota archaeon]|nr:hypothetical protein [Nanoarchaeota archaeon]MBU1270286.1 hypothetical protein [Nanoarchaeota archaeon]MBU1605179.1 hypothetical protein [Nanoarchaeota archaeon]MBU2442537.1 hypothetical protein [Nanoarchaeota archaeon]
MAKIEIVESLYNYIEKKFKQEGHKIFDLIYTLENNPKKGKYVGNIGGIVIKELKYKNFRFYFLADGYKLKFFTEEELTDILLRFVRMSDKKNQQRIIQEIKEILLKIGLEGFK